ncbi:MAG: hypothetical protein ABIH36_01475 [bacterium]
MFPDDRERRRVVVIITRTSNCEARHDWADKLCGLGCEVVALEPEDLMEYMKNRGLMDGVMLDDVFPPDTPEMKRLASMLIHVRPEPKIAFLVARYDDYHGLQHLVGDNGQVIVHHDGQPMMDEVYKHLAGTNKCVEPLVMLLH